MGAENVQQTIKMVYGFITIFQLINAADISFMAKMVKASLIDSMT